ncbi:hypothetical protein DFJ43DRAFT_1157271 [Lentinula guzmanii]|uniref:Uncharacterized protein n=2 Tax=Lentinula TaxID=5352 RepID=A0AA38J6Y0_9AGAR|nr:hypothetical protein DFJ43DRAFT_1157271 [Lentinula guzmanii]KAJ3741779.1 hypothetical protein DFH05DRAFT_1502547 [Lentinula detonsa]KAJ3799391.1 hypothetical protein GGU11DRAFT_743404 [Lentinula aff. detonsa]KAJ3986071.1 hypothetical protein F5890DRAFT_1552573 [Lentinula detonsa]
MSTSGATAQDSNWKAREQSEEARFIHEKEQAKIAAIRDQLNTADKTQPARDSTTSAQDRDFEGGFGGQEDLEDRYATTSGEH